MKAIIESRGFIALMTMILISSVLLVTTLSLAQFSLTHRSFILNLEHKNTSAHLAEACVHLARVMVINNPDHFITFPRTFPVDQGFCTIHSTLPAGMTSTTETSGTHHGISTNYVVTIDNSDGSFLSWEEMINP